MAELISAACLLAITAYIMIDIHNNKNKEWANDPLVGLSCCAMVVGDIFLVVYLFLIKNKGAGIL